MVSNCVRNSHNLALNDPLVYFRFIGDTSFARAEHPASYEGGRLQFHHYFNHLDAPTNSAVTWHVAVATSRCVARGGTLVNVRPPRRNVQHSLRYVAYEYVMDTDFFIMYPP